MKKRIGRLLTLALLICLVFGQLTGCGKKAGDRDDDEEVVREVDEEESEAESEEEEVETRTYTIFEQFLGFDPDNKVAATVDDGVYLGYADFDGDNVGKTLTFDELLESLSANRLDPEGDEVEAVFSYVGYDDKQSMVIKFLNMHTDGNGDDSYTLVFLGDVDGELHITYSASEWSRNYLDLNKYGYIHSMGSAGAGEQVGDAGFIGPQGKYCPLYTVSELYADWIAMELNSETYYSFYDADNQCNLCVSEYIINDEKYYTYENVYDSEITANDEAYIAACKAEGMNFLTEEEFDAMLEEEIAGYGYNKEYIDNYDQVSWKAMGELAGNRVETYFLDPATDAGYWNSTSTIGFQVNYDTVLSSQLASHGSAELSMEDLSYLDIDLEADEYEDESKMFFIKEAKDKISGGFFQIYVTDKRNTVIITPDGSMVKLYISPIDFIYGTIPELTVADYDNDGESELAVWEYILHGTGFSQDTMYIVDKDKEYDSWDAYLLSPKWYVKEFAKQYKAVDKGDAIEVYLDDELVNTTDKNGDTTDMELRGAYMIEVTTDGKEITVMDTPVFYSTGTPVGLMAGSFNLKIKYEGDGNWSLDRCEYIEE